MKRAGETLGIALVVWLTVAASAAARPMPGPYEGAAHSFLNVLPPGQSGTVTAGEFGAFTATGTRPEESSDQLHRYEDLVYASPELKPRRIRSYFKDASFGVKPGDVESRYQPCGEANDPCNPAFEEDHPCDEVTVQRDAGYGVPHIYGATRAGAMCAAGYVAAEDRLFLIDVLRHAGRAELTQFIGGANRAMDREQWAIAPYREQDLRRQLTQFDDLYGRAGDKLGRDLIAYVAGLNQYVFEARRDRESKMPVEYEVLLGQENTTAGPENFEKTDIVAIASLVGGIFGKGGGQELDSALFLQSAQDRLGSEAGEEVWADFRSAEDPEAPTTVAEERFPYQVPPKRPVKASLAIPDPGSVEKTDVVASTTDASDPDEGFLGDLFRQQGAGSNALLVSGTESASGHPIAVFGPQTAYFSPQLLMEMDIHGPGIDARGAAFAGTNLYVQLGRGMDYAWSATSAGQDNVDTFALELCDPAGGTPTIESEGYLYRGRCRPFDVLERRNEYAPNPGDPSGPGLDVLRVNRTKLGLEVARATIDGDPVVYVQLRSTYMHEVDSARGFADFNNPNKIRGPRDFQRAAHKIGYTFNWFYTDSDDIAYFNSGENPERAAGVDPNFPVRACPTAACEFEWKGYQPIRAGGPFTGNRARYTPFDEHPQVINQRFLTNWNNKQAPGFRSSDGQFGYHSLYRSIPLDERIRRGTKGERTMTRIELIDAAQSAATVDLRGDQVLPWLLKVLRTGSAQRSTAGDRERPARPSAEARGAGAVLVEAPCSPDLGRSRAVAILARWHADGAHRRDRDGDERYEHSCALEIMDAWWPRLVRNIFKPTLGDDAYDLRVALGEIDNEPNGGGAHYGSAYQDGFYGYVAKDLRTLLGEDVRGRYSRTYCGGGKAQEGSLADCRALLEETLAGALAVPREDLYDDDEVCETEGDGLDPQYCFDAIYSVPVGVLDQPLIHWVNRPTFQQAVEVQQSVPRGPSDGSDSSE